MSTEADWRALGASELATARLDPCLALAEAAAFADQGGDAPGRLWPVSLQVDDPGYRPSGVAGLQLCGAHEGSAFVTARATRPAIAALGNDTRVLRLQWAAAQVPHRRWPQLQSAAAAPAAAGGDAADGPGGGVLLGVIDDGCPFAHPDLLRADGTPRVLRLWNQDVAAVSPAGPPAGFDYGAEHTRADLQALCAAARGGANAVDAAACYSAAGLPRLRHAHSHGAHVLGLLAGARRWDGSPRRAGPLVSGAAGATAHQASGEADIAFVQLPQAVLQSVSVAAVEHHAWDGVRYLCNLAARRGCSRLVIVFAYESWVGPHDGSSWFEQALDSLLDPARSGPAALAGLQIQLVMPAGNSRQRAVHAQLQGGVSSQTLRWHLPPGNEEPSLIELWGPPGGPGLNLRLTPPGAAASPWQAWGSSAPAGGAVGSGAGLVLLPASPQGGGRPQLLLQLRPTSAQGPRAAARHGVWTLELESPPGYVLPTLHARIGRVEAALALPRRNRQATFVQRTPDQANADRLHTLNGHACGQRTQVAGVWLGPGYPYLDQPAQDNRGQPRRYRPPGRPAGSASLLRGHAADYSGSGPSEGLRSGPDASLAVEDGALWPGVLSLGCTSAGVFRLSGSSTAAALWARALADAPQGRVTTPPLPGVARDDPALGRPSARN